MTANAKVKSEEPTLASQQRKEQVSRIFRDYGIAIIFLALVLVLALTTPRFIRIGNIYNVMRQSSVNALLALGMTFVILSGGIDLSVGSVLAFGGVLAASMVSQAFGGFVLPAYVGLGLALLGGAVLGAVNGYFVAKWRVPAFVVTLGMLSIARGLTLIYTDGRPIPRVSEQFQFFGQGYIFGAPMPVIITLGMFLFAALILYRTPYGRYIYAVGGNEMSARVSGVNTRLIKFSVYVISGMTAALGGVLLTARTTAGLPQAGVAYELNAIAAVVIGGTRLSGGQGTLFGTLIGALIIGVINNALNLLGVSAYYQQLIQGAIIVLAVLLDQLRKQDD